MIQKSKFIIWSMGLLMMALSTASSAAEKPNILVQDYPFQAGSSLTAANIGYHTIERQKALGNLDRLMDISIKN